MVGVYAMVMPTGARPWNVRAFGDACWGLVRAKVFFLCMKCMHCRQLTSQGTILTPTLPTFRLQGFSLDALIDTFEHFPAIQQVRVPYWLHLLCPPPLFLRGLTHTPRPTRCPRLSFDLHQRIVQHINAFFVAKQKDFLHSSAVAREVLLRQQKLLVSRSLTLRQTSSTRGQRATGVVAQPGNEKKNGSGFHKLALDETRRGSVAAFRGGMEKIVNALRTDANQASFAPCV